jgi:opacity protein-like surface antigen
MDSDRSPTRHAVPSALSAPAVAAVLVAATGLLATDAAMAGEGYFLGVGLPQLSIEGDFDGESFYINNQSIEFVPKWDDSKGYRLTGGYRDDRFYYLASYTKVDLDGSGVGLTPDITPILRDYSGEYEALFVEVSYLFLPRDLHPYVGGGIGISKVKVAGASTDLAGTFGQSSYKGEIKYQVGFGLLYDIGRSFSIDLRYAQLFGKYSELNGLTKGDDVDFDMDGTEISLTLQYYFGF